MAQLSAFGEGLGDIRDSISGALTARPETKISLPELKPKIHIDLQPLAQQVARFSEGLQGIKELLADQKTEAAAQCGGVRSEEVADIRRKIDSVNEDLQMIHELIIAYRGEQAAAREASEKEI